MFNGKTSAFYTLGCKLNFSETSTISRQLKEIGFLKNEFNDGADLFVINTCSVTENANKECRRIIRKAKKISPNSIVVVTGCFAQLKPKSISEIVGVDMVLGANEKFNLPKVVSVQNPYSLLNRSYEVGMAEISIREKCGLLAYSPLAFGMLTGKYDNGEQPDGARLTLFGNMFTRYTKDKGLKYSQKFNNLARESGITPTQMALGFVNSRPFVTSNIIGATDMNQLKENIDSIDITLDKQILSDIQDIHLSDPNPCV